MARLAYSAQPLARSHTKRPARRTRTPNGQRDDLAHQGTTRTIMTPPQRLTYTARLSFARQYCRRINSNGRVGSTASRQCRCAMRCVGSLTRQRQRVVARSPPGDRSQEPHNSNKAVVRFDHRPAGDALTR